ncbi:ParB N-terminal domain-containing protein [Pectobacterium aroidearum]|uniref:ParB N-terminal domain-containing protein n=1 Tax=Pectobacterium aroidearum TaxID=1201031 RepID=UPI003A6805F9
MNLLATVAHAICKILVPLSRLVSCPTDRSVRKTPRMSIPELADSISRVGLLQNLLATADGEHYRVLAGGQRLAGGRRTAAGVGRWLAELRGSRQGCRRCHRPQLRGYDSSCVATVAVEQPQAEALAA